MAGNSGAWAGVASFAGPLLGTGRGRLGAMAVRPEQLVKPFRKLLAQDEAA